MSITSKKLRSDTGPKTGRLTCVQGFEAATYVTLEALLFNKFFNSLDERLDLLLNKRFCALELFQPWLLGINLVVNVLPLGSSPSQ